MTKTNIFVIVLSKEAKRTLTTWSDKKEKEIIERRKKEMLVFLIILLYLVCFIPVIHLWVKDLREKEFGKGEVKRKICLTVGGVVVLSLGLAYSGIYVDSLWFESLGYESVFWKRLATQWALFWSIASVSFILLGLNAWVLKKSLKPFLTEENEGRFNWIAYPVAGAIALIMGAFGPGKCDQFLLFFSQVKAGVTDPIFQKDIGFYLFSYPVQSFLSWVVFATWFIAGIAIGLTYLSEISNAREEWPSRERSRWSRREEKEPEDEEPKEINNLSSRSLTQISLWSVGFLLILIWRFILEKYHLVLSGGLVAGAGYTDVHLRIPALTLMIVISAIFAGVLLVSVFRSKIWSWRKIEIGTGTFLAILIFSLGIVPAVYQSISVGPNELTKETPYLEYNIPFAREAYGLDNVEEKVFDYQPSISYENLSQNKETLENIRLWDWRALIDTYRQEQRITLYYEFSDVDIDRYMINGEYRQVMLAARELDKSRLEESARNWFNLKLLYTHGYGVILNKVNEFIGSGTPNYLIKDIPPESDVQELNITRPEIYFGRLTQDHVIVGTTQKEFDYPSEGGNVFCTYQGTGGVEIGSGFRRLAIALQFDSETFFSNAIKPESRILFNREIHQMLQIIAPFLTLDKDDYLVIDPQSGRLFYMVDAYTTSHYYPYSEPCSEGFNYIRNSVKVVIDTYNGTVDLYVFDESDPIIQAWQKAFPGLFKPKSSMPPALMAHIRYPEDILSVQAEMYCKYHMVNPTDLFQTENLWRIAEEIYSQGTTQKMIPYFVNLRLPDETKAEFIQMIAFTPKAVDRNNLVGWLAGRCDGENYGKLLAFEFPRQQLVYGPMQFEARVDQNDEMLKTFSLWQRETDVIRGNTLVIPIENTVMYIEPVYLKARQSAMPEIKKIIVSIGDKLEWGDSFEEALGKVIGKTIIVPPTTPVLPSEILEKIWNLSQSAQQHFTDYLRLTGEAKFAEAAEALTQSQEEQKELIRILESIQ